MHVVAYGLRKSFGLPFKPLTSEEKQKGQRGEEEIKTIQQSFLAEIERNRQLTEETIEEISSGKAWLDSHAGWFGVRS